LYRVLAPLVAAALLPGFLLRMKRRGGYRQNFGQRLGWFSERDRETLQSGGWTWIHSISVGETLVALKLARALRAIEPSIRIAISTTTSTGFAIAKEAAQEGLFPMYNPVDNLGAVRRTLNLLRPPCVVFIEGDAWPNLLAECHVREIPTMLANARLSPRSASRFTRFKRWVRPIFSLLEWIGAPDRDAAGWWDKIVVPTSKIRITGNIKFDQVASSSDSRTAEFQQLLCGAGISPEMPLLIAGSTHAGEEFILAKLLNEWRTTHQTLRLILVPRHAERSKELLREIANLGFRVMLRSELGKAGIAENPDIIIVDTTGELRDWYTLATVIFVGKSLTGIGGQNPIEPALAGKPVVFGIHMENFQAVVDQLLRVNGAVQIADERELFSAVENLLSDPARRDAVAGNAILAVEKHQGATQKTVELILASRRAIPRNHVSIQDTQSGLELHR
jgi:3-deoxy-D-manno-octulosonic-acid transferase